VEEQCDWSVELDWPMGLLPCEKLPFPFFCEYGSSIFDICSALAICIFLLASILILITIMSIAKHINNNNLNNEHICTLLIFCLLYLSAMGYLSMNYVGFAEIIVYTLTKSIQFSIIDGNQFDAKIYAIGIKNIF
jgi:hypothetical protein